MNPDAVVTDGLVGRCFGRSQRRVALWLGVLLLVFAPSLAHAACSVGDMFALGGSDAASCANTGGIFDSIMCFFKNTIGTVMGEMYCAFQSAIIPPLAVAIALFISAFGVMVYFGIVNLTAREAAVALVKMGLVWAFASNADFAIGFAYKLFIGLLAEGSNMVLSTLPAVKFDKPDTVFTGFMNFFGNPTGTNINSCGAGLCVDKNVITTLTDCGVFLALVALALVLFLPIIIIFFVIMLLEYLKLYAGALLSYLQALVLVAFLFVFSPLFFSFALFRTTFNLFSRWLAFITSWSVQTLVLFGFLALLGLATQNFNNFIYSVLKLFRTYNSAIGIGPITIPINTCSICEYKLHTPASTGVQSIECLPAVVTASIPILMPDLLPPPVGKEPLFANPYDLSGAEITYLKKDMLGSILSAKPNPVLDPPDPVQDGGRNFIVPLTSILKRSDFLVFIVANVIAFWVITKTLQEFIKKVPALSQALGSLSVAAALGGNASQGEGIRLAGRESMAAALQGFKLRFQQNPFNLNWKQRFTESFIGKRVEFNDAGKRVSFREGGFVGGLLYGSNDKPAPVFFGAEHDITRQRRRVDEVSNRLEEAQKLTQQHATGLANAYKELERLKADPKADPMAVYEAYKHLNRSNRLYKQAHDNMLSTHRGYRKERDLLEQVNDQKPQMRGLLGSRQYDGKKDPHKFDALSDNTVFHTPYGSRVNEMVEERRKKRMEKKKYGKFLNQAAGNKDPGMVDPTPGFSIKSAPETITNMHTEVQGMFDTVQGQFMAYGRFLKDAQRDKFAQTLEDAQKKLGSARTPKDYQDVMKDLTGVAAVMADFNNTQILTEASNAAMSGMKNQLGTASTLVSAPHLQQVITKLNKVQGGLKQARTEQDFDMLLAQLDDAPRQLADAVMNGLENQLALASRLVNDARLAPLNQKLDKARTEWGGINQASDYIGIVRGLDQTPRQLADAVFAGLESQIDLARRIAPTQFSVMSDGKEYKVAGEYLGQATGALLEAKKAVGNAQKGEHYEDTLRQLHNVPGMLLGGAISSLNQRIEKEKDGLSADARKSIENTMGQAQFILATSSSGQAMYDALRSLGNVTNELERAAGKTASMPDVPPLGDSPQPAAQQRPIPREPFWTGGGRVSVNPDEGATGRIYIRTDSDQKAQDLVRDLQARGGDEMKAAIIDTRYERDGSTSVVVTPIVSPDMRPIMDELRTGFGQQIAGEAGVPAGGMAASAPAGFRTMESKPTPEKMQTNMNFSLEKAKSDMEIASTRMTDSEARDYTRQIDSLSEELKSAGDNEESLKDVQAKINKLNEQITFAINPDSLKGGVMNSLGGIDHALNVASGIYPPATVNAIRAAVASARGAMAKARTYEDIQDVISQINAIRLMMM